MLEYLVVLLLGVIIGVFTGLIPGIHPNTLIFMFLPFYFSFSVDLMLFMAFVCGVSVSHTFHNFLPAVFMGIPEAESALSALPGAEMAANGRGIPAFKYTLLGGMYSMLFLLLVTPLLYLGLEYVYGYIETFMAQLLAFFLLTIIFMSDNLLKATSTSLFTGLLGYLALTGNFNQQYILIPVFAGLFAIPQIWKGLEDELEIPEQENDTIPHKVSRKGGLLGFLAGLMAGIFPGLGPAVSTSFLAPKISSTKEFLAGMGGVNTADIVMSFLALYLIGNPRSGASVALQSLKTIELQDVIFLAGLCIFAAFLSGIIALKTSLIFVKLLERVDFQRVLKVVGFFLVAVTFALTGLRGLVVLFAASAIGIKAVIEEHRAICMSVLIIPAIIFYI